ncbi:hypothetical protein ZWY2020_015482 [Hordeum vulgare]|nr:hypothetical protein ZWY2020_015482 [Hordeum vulgare]
MLVGRSTTGVVCGWPPRCSRPAAACHVSVGCHKLPFPYRVYQCHMTAGLTDKAYVVSLRGLAGGGPTAKMLAFCHFDTAKWNPAHPAFEVLGTHPGTPVCHFMPYANPVFGMRTTKP